MMQTAATMDDLPRGGSSVARGGALTLDARGRRRTGSAAAGEEREALDAVLAEGTPVGDFRIRRLLGEGAMGQVYLAQDLTLGRHVALKLIRRSLMHGDGVARFLEEARATASFNHPHIVTIHAVGEHDGRPYLALEYLDGESLRARISAGPLPVRAALRCIRAIAEAVAEAHRRGLVHTDLKPENILVPRDGRVRVVDFGLAKLVGDAPGSVSGTPAYMAPERWRNAPPTGAIDVWALGLILHELVTGRRPISEATLMRMAYARGSIELPGLPAEPWAQLVRDCLVRDPAARPSADELARRIGALLDPRAAIAGGADARCPFPGLAAFSREHAADYFGRRAELDAIVEQLRTRALIPIVGPSGIGKSSFVQAALLPRLDEAGRWIALSLRPGASPFDGLAAALAPPGRAPAELAAELRRSPDRLSLVLGGLARHHDARILLFLDQFEETFTLAAEGADAIAFCDCLARAADPAAPWRIVLTLRDDFLGRLAAAPAMRPLLGGVLFLGPLSAADLRAAVAGPLANTGYEADAPALIARIVDDVAGQPACLPLLQFACRALWERRDAETRRLLTAEYDAMGGATGALASHAERLLAALAPDEVRLVRAILLSLVHPDGTRHPRLRAELLDGLPAGSRELAERLLERLLDRRLLASIHDAGRDAPALELAHEALVTAWPRLARWLDETYEERVLVTELDQASQLWQRRGRRDAETWGGAALAEAVRKIEERNVALGSVSSAFLDASRRRDRRILRRRRWWTLGLGAAAITAGIAALAFARTSQELDLAAADLGRVRLELVPFDWDPALQRRRAPAARPPLEWRIYGTSPDDPREKGHAYGDRDLRRGDAAWRGEALIEDIEVRSGPTFIEIRGRGGDCAPSLLHLQRLPGYRERAAAKRIEIAVPTCQASRASMVEIPAGPYLRPVKQNGQERDEQARVPGYAIDRTEVTRGAFELFAAMAHLTGVRFTPADFLITDLAATRRMPVSGIDHAIARAYCRYLGKDLPTSDQWHKAARGGLVLADGRPNPAPARSTPWDGPAAPGVTNLTFGKDQGRPAPVGAHPADTSPYGILDLGGNVREWSLEPSTTRPGMRQVYGGSWESSPDDGLVRLYYTNVHVEEYRNYALGARCVSVP